MSKNPLFDLEIRVRGTEQLTKLRVDDDQRRAAVAAYEAGLFSALAIKPVDPVASFKAALRDTQERYMVGPKNELAVLLTIRADGANVYSSIERNGKHIEGSSRGHGNEQVGRSAAMQRWMNLRDGTPVEFA